jgi:hypothetical protein
VGTPLHDARVIRNRAATWGATGWHRGGMRIEFPRIKELPVRIRRIAVAALLATAVVVPSASGVAVAKGKPSAVSPSTGKSDKHGKNDKSGKAAKPVKFVASGTVTAVDAGAGTVTVKVKGGTKDVRRTTVTVTVPSTARIVVNGAGKTLADIAVGYGITVTGTHAGDVLTAVRIEARGRKGAVKPSPAPSAGPTPTTSPEPPDDVTPTPADSPTPTDSSSPAATS